MALCDQCRSDDLLGRAEQYMNGPENWSFFHNIVESNDPASPPQIARVKNTILPNIDNDLESVSVRLQHLYDAAAALEDEHTTLLEARHRYSTIISPIRSFPVELLSEILLHASSRDVWDMNAPQWQFGQISRAWRAASIFCHRIWTSVDFTFAAMLQNSSTAARLQEVFARSGQLSLDVAMRGSPAYHPSGSELLEVMFSQSERWASADFVLRGDLETIFVPLHNRLPMLRELSLWIPTMGRHGFDEANPIAVSGFSSCPRLTKFTCSCSSLNWTIDIPWSRLTSLNIEGDDIDSWSFERFCALLRKCTSLRSLGFFTGFDEAMFDSVPTEFNFRSLDTGNDSLLLNLILPKLEEAGICAGGIPTVKHLSYLITKSDCTQTLTVLRLFDMQFFIKHALVNEDKELPLMSLLFPVRG